MGKIWLTSDWHLHHDKDFMLQPRGFSSAEEMNQEILERHNSLVDDNDIVIVLGDVLLGGPATEEKAKYLKQFKGIKRLGIGNHDTDAKIKLYKELNIFDDIQFAYRFKAGKIEFICSHYQFLVANKDDPKPIWNIHGHTHSQDAFCDIPHCYNVNMEAHNCYPVDIEQIISECKSHI